MNRSLKLTFVFAGFLASAGCATVTATPVTSKNPDPSGVRVKVSRSIVLARDGVPSVVQIADPCNEYAMRFDAFLAVNKTKMKLNTDGTLASLDTELDSTEVIELLKEAAGNITPSASGLLEGASHGGAQTQVFDLSCGPDGNLVIIPLLELPLDTAATTQSGPSLDAMD